ncbi:MAG: hypothetical protein BRC51_14775 [Cyanobacteria bacterium SW_12_48_29]|nr:MAG: hypothetical protein BRC51_14775 [Cyanobacteria bacterium SW_12_48_29]PSP03403.1 MAG: hypothetical protein BRC54_12435 [Cyanobacteria bacterium SW_7_48_12]PSP12848.1 MAG: hypothetical protein BRC49_03950 [Cyanobacteria bacterium SW_10_48_33]
MQNHSLRQEPRNQPAPVIPLQQEYSLLDWLEANDRLLEREVEGGNTPVEEEEEISELMEGDDKDYRTSEEPSENLLEDAEQ